MRYRIERMEGQHCHFVNGRQELLSYLKHAPAGTVTDIRKVYKNGVSDSVMETYLPYIRSGSLSNDVAGCPHHWQKPFTRYKVSGFCYFRRFLPFHVGGIGLPFPLIFWGVLFVLDLLRIRINVVNSSEVRLS